jgi:hypothetical protein
METTKERAFDTDSETSTLSATADKADEAAMAAGERLQATADMIRDKAPHEGRLGTAASVVAERLEGAGTYLQEQGVSGAVEDAGTLIRRYPVQSLLLGLGMGYLLARMRVR